MTDRSPPSDVPHSIPRRPDLPEAEDFDALFERGLARLRAVSGAVWTDHNLHDPGITILEILCFALTDIAYRMAHPIEDLIATLGTNLDTLPVGAKALAPAPVTEADIVASLCDQLPGVRNLWFDGPMSPTGGKTLYYTNFDGEDVTKESVAAAFQEIRPLGLHLTRIVPVEPLKTIVRLSVEIEENIDPTDMTAQLMDELERTLNPIFRFRDPAELGADPDPFVLYDGPQLSAGLVRRSPRPPLAATEIASETTAQTLAKELSPVLRKTLSQQDGVSQITSLEIRLPQRRDLESRYAVFTLTERAAQINLIKPLRNGVTPPSRLPGQAPKDLALRQGHIRASLRHRRDLIRAERSKFTITLDKLRAPSEAPWSGRNLQGLTEYQSIQQDFPTAYRLFRLSKAKFPEVAQLRGYLALFEQHLVNLIGQLEQAITLLVPESLPAGAMPTAYRNRSLSQMGADAPGANGFDALLHDDRTSRRADYENALGAEARAADPRGALAEQAIDHALARSGIVFEKAGLAILSADPAEAEVDPILNAKRAFLDDSVMLNQRRGGLEATGRPIAAHRIELLSLLETLVIIENWRLQDLENPQANLWRLPPLSFGNDDRNAISIEVSKTPELPEAIPILLRYIPGQRLADVVDNDEIPKILARVGSYNVLNSEDDSARLVLYTGVANAGPILHVLRPFPSAKAAEDTAKAIYATREKMTFRRISFPPNSFDHRLTVVAQLPPAIAEKPDECAAYQHFAEGIIRANLPAHLAVDLFWAEDWPIEDDMRGCLAFKGFAAAAADLTVTAPGDALPNSARQLLATIASLHYAALFGQDDYLNRSERTSVAQ